MIRGDSCPGHAGPALGHGSHAKIAQRRTRTDADGRFVLEGEFSFSWQLEPTPYLPTLHVEHPQYGWAEASAGGLGFEEIRLTRDAFVAEGLLGWDERCYASDPDRCFWVCYGEPACLAKRVIEPR